MLVSSSSRLPAAAVDDGTVLRQLRNRNLAEAMATKRQWEVTERGVP